MGREQSQSFDETPSSGSAGRRSRVLIVEDDAESREGLAEALRVSGYSVVTACNGANALSKLDRAALPDVILLDLAMPVMNGYAFSKSLQADPELSRIPVLLCTSERETESVPAEALLAKPVDLRVLLLAIETRCERRAS